jgi:sterol 14-demethylase
MVELLQVAVAIVVLAAVYTFMTKRSGNTPPVVGAIPWIGYFFTYAKNPIAAVRKAYDKYGDIFTLKLIGFNMTFMIGPEAQAAFFRFSDDEVSPKEAYKFVVPVFGPGIVYDSPTEVMYEQLRFVRSSLALSQLKTSVGIMASESAAYFKANWGDSGEKDLLQELNALTVLTASRCLMGNDIRDVLSQDPTKLADLYHDLEQGLNPISFFFPHLPLPSHKQRDRAREAIAKIFREIVKQRKVGGQKHDDILSILMECEYKDGTILEDEHLVSMMIALLFAGQHTSSITATWTGLNLLREKKYLKEVMDELSTVKKELGSDITFDSLRKQVRLESCVREALRMYPPLIQLVRKVLQPITYKGYTIPAGHLISVSPSVGMRIPEAYKNPDTYDPHRFDRGEDKITPFHFLAFGGGKHGCPGENFGVLQVKTIWTVLLETYDLEWVNPQMPDFEFQSLVIGPKAPTLLRYKKKASAK